MTTVFNPLYSNPIFVAMTSQYLFYNLKKRKLRSQVSRVRTKQHTGLQAWERVKDFVSPSAFKSKKPDDKVVNGSRDAPCEAHGLPSRQTWVISLTRTLDSLLFEAGSRGNGLQVPEVKPCFPSPRQPRIFLIRSRVYASLYMHRELEMLNLN